MDLGTRHRSGGAVLHFGRRERGDRSLVIGSDLVRECTGLKVKHDKMFRLVDGVRAVVGDRFYNQRAGFFGLRTSRVIGGDLGIVGTCDHDKKATVCVEDVDALWISAKLFQSAAIWAHLIR